MKKTLLVVLVFLLVFFVSAAASFLYKSMKGEVAKEETPAEEAPAAPATPPPAADAAKSSVTKKAEPSEPAPPPIAVAPTDAADKEIRVGVRPPYVEGSEETAQLASLLKSRLDAVRERESQLSFRTETLRMFEDDIRSQQKQIDEVKSQVDDSMKDVNQFLDKQLQAIDLERNEIKTREATIRQRLVEIDRTESGNISGMSRIYENMPPENSALIFQQLARTDRLDTVVKLLSSMKERSAARVLAEVSNLDKELAAVLTDKLRGVKKPNATGPAGGAPGNTRPTAPPTPAATAAPSTAVVPGPALR